MLRRCPAPEPGSHRSVRRTESGQAIVLIALMMVGLLGFTGLALDGGSLLLLQRRAQKVADIAAMSAAIARCNGENESVIRARAEEAAAANEVGASAVDVSFLSSTDTEVVVRLPKDPYFIHIVYDGPMTAQGRSVVRCSTAESPGSAAGEYVLFATSEVCDSTLHVSAAGGLYEGAVKSNNVAQFNNGPVVRITGPLHFVGEARQRAMVWNPTTSRLEPQGITNAIIGGYGPPNYTLDNSGAAIHAGPVEDAPLLYTIDDFRPGGAIWNQIPENRRHAISGGQSWHWPGTGGTPELPASHMQGLLFVDGDLGMQGSGNFNATGGDGLTIVATGTVRLSGNNVYLKPYWENLQVMSGAGGYTRGVPVENLPSTTTGGNCQLDAIQFNTSNFAFGTESKPGLLYAPWGTTHIPVSSINTSYGQIIAYKIHNFVANAHIVYRPAVPATGTADTPTIYYTE